MPRPPITLESPSERDAAPIAVVRLDVLPDPRPREDDGEACLLKGPWHPTFDDAFPYEPVI